MHETRVDVAIVGSGFAGLGAAVWLWGSTPSASRGLRVRESRSGCTCVALWVQPVHWPRSRTQTATRGFTVRRVRGVPR